ncbi:uncharacterized protein [Drosophila virilis]|uniref:uncharacterized protein n=1 Tax=Drosophila virilis TaxID=7244 RepID=UPI0038B4088C
MARSPLGVPTAAPTETNSGREPTTANQSSSALRELGQEISKLVIMLEDGKQGSIHQPMRESIESIRVLYELAAIQLQDEGAKARWNTANKGRWTLKLILNLDQWIRKRNGEMNFHVTQFFTGYGGYRKYFHRFRHEDAPEYPNCPNLDEVVLYQCRQTRAAQHYENSGRRSQS